MQLNKQCQTLSSRSVGTSVTIKITNGQKQIKNCICCSIVEIKQLYFSTCQHKGQECVHCREIYMLSQIKKNKYPTCYQQGCHAKMIFSTNDIKKKGKLFFDYFSQDGKQKWKQFYQEYNKQNRKQFLKECQVADCPGVIQFNRCTKCGVYYCEKCGNLDHQSNVPCVQKITIDPNVKQCPNCKEQYVKEEGCQHIICGNLKCQHQFCYVCGKDWTPTHYLCQQKKPVQPNMAKKHKNVSCTGNCCIIF